MKKLRFLLLAGLVAATASITGCFPTDPGLEEADLFTCGDNTDCSEGFECIDFICQRPSTTGLCEDKDGDGGFVGDFCDPTTQPFDCDDTNGQIGPNAVEICDGVDNDCNPETTEDTITMPCEKSGIGVCAVVTQTCMGGMLVPASCEEGCPGDTCPYGPDYVEEEGLNTCGDGKDNDCDNIPDDKEDVCPSCTPGEACNTFLCNGMVPEAQCACKPGTYACDEMGNRTCVDSNGQPVRPPLLELEVCGNNMDDNCDGNVDEASCQEP